MTRPHPPTGDRLRMFGAGQTVDRADAEQVWDAALCAQTDPDLFFPGKGEEAQAARALAVCGRCEVTELCLATFGPLLGHGVVGGQTVSQRNQARRRAWRAA